MSQDPAGLRPKRFPAPEFPPRQTRLFARTPPVIFTALAGLMSLPLVLREVLIATDLPVAAADMAAGLLLAFWLFCIFALAVRIVRRPSVIKDDFRVIVSRNGLFAATISGMIAGQLIRPLWPVSSFGLTLVALVAHLVLALVFFTLAWRRRRESGPHSWAWPDPGMQLIYAGPLVVVPALIGQSWTGAALVLSVICLVPAGLALLAGLIGLLREQTPAPLRPMLVLHLAPVALCASVALNFGQETLAAVLGLAALVMLFLIVAAAGWLGRAGFTPIWGCAIWPVVLVADSMAQGGATATSVAVLLAVSVFSAVVCWRIFRLWPKGKLADMTNTGEA
ncbi:hypothetical protein [Rhodobacter sp. 24-YEA-8]|uniref:hypothetical protein n=1 Tax=Rhodobacter sp. 24-YEA-8 TaxID=1884310 RepID=UPI00089C5136|nr:hypothetical protein [Rhodobacter sp. 24-YEA-8]SEB82757.1 tellurite resistance protein [Rhodobacter sp. 24-YEA-8]